MAEQFEEHVLSTLEADGSRRWLKPRLSRGRFLTRRRIVAYILMALFFLIPLIPINGHPAMFLDIVHRRFYLFGYTFLPTDTVLLALFMLCLFVGIFLFTAIFGRLWCGWACPQTVYLEFLYRPIERLFDGTYGKGGKSKKPMSPVRKVGYFLTCLLVTALPAHTFLAYFVGAENLRAWVLGSPLAHPTAFLVVMAVTFLMMFDFFYFREQLCIVACPYGRFQSVLLDRHSLIVNYDAKRGEPRGKVAHLPVVNEGQGVGDCVDCHLCVVTCPTGIDIRDGLQLECINCTQCIDACDSVMTKLGRAVGLIRYGSQAAMAGEPVKRIRPRVILYPVLMVVLSTLWLVLFINKGTADVTILRERGNPYTQLSDGSISNTLKLKITNRTDQVQAYHIEVASGPGAVKIVVVENPLKIEARKDRTEGFIVAIAPEEFIKAGSGSLDLALRVRDEAGFSKTVNCKVLGPLQ